MARRNRSRGSGLLRALNLVPFLPLAGRAPMYARLLWALAQDPRVPAARKALLGIAGAYIISPFDLVPERIPFVGALDDVAVMVLAIDVFLEGLPETLVNEKLVELGIAPSELEDDLARVRRLVPKPVRALIGRVPGVIDRVAERVASTGVEDRVRATVARRVNPETAVLGSGS
ncbi:MAG: YkvA family protein [Candidatus Limnocylindrales bacterium]